MDTIQRNSNSIDRLALLVSKMNVKWTKERPHTSLGFIKVDRPRGQSRNRQQTFSPIIDPSVEIGIEIGTTTTTETIIGPTIGIGPGTPTDVTIEGITISQVTGRVITGKTIEETVID